MSKKWYEEIFDDEFINRSLIKEKHFKKIDSKNDYLKPLPTNPLARFLYSYQKEIKLSIIIIGSILTLTLVYLISILP